MVYLIFSFFLFFNLQSMEGPSTSSPWQSTIPEEEVIAQCNALIAAQEKTFPFVLPMNYEKISHNSVLEYSYALKNELNDYVVKRYNHVSSDDPYFNLMLYNNMMLVYQCSRVLKSIRNTVPDSYKSYFDYDYELYLNSIEGPPERIPTFCSDLTEHLDRCEPHCYEPWQIELMAAKVDAYRISFFKKEMTMTDHIVLETKRSLNNQILVFSGLNSFTSLGLFAVGAALGNAVSSALVPSAIFCFLGSIGCCIGASAHRFKTECVDTDTNDERLDEESQEHLENLRRFLKSYQLAMTQEIEES